MYVCDCNIHAIFCGFNVLKSVEEKCNKNVSLCNIKIYKGNQCIIYMLRILHKINELE